MSLCVEDDDDDEGEEEDDDSVVVVVVVVGCANTPTSTVTSGKASVTATPANRDGTATRVS